MHKCGEIMLLTSIVWLVSACSTVPMGRCLMRDFQDINREGNRDSTHNIGHSIS